MNRLITRLSVSILMVAGLPATCATLMEVIEADPDAAAIVANNPIRVSATQEAAIPFDRIIQLVRSEDALTLVQNAYGETLPKGEKPEFVITLVEGTKDVYTYVNKKKIRTYVKELVRRVSEAGEIEVVYFVQSKRFFGPFSAVVTMVGRQSDEALSTCEAEIYAYPEKNVPRFFIRHLRLVERFFKKKTVDLREIFTDVVTRACEDLGEDAEVGASETAMSVKEEG